MPSPGPVVLIACDKFKGTLTAAEACSAVAAGVLDIWPQAKCILRPMADGGEGTARVICEALGGEWRTVPVIGPRGETEMAGFAWLADQRTAVIEMSEASGLKLVPPAQRNPWRMNTAGTGELMRHAMTLGAEKLVVGIGGSATNDGGSGMAWALGYQFLNEAGEPIVPVPANLLEVVRIIPPAGLKLPEIVAACDVTNPLLGREGATTVYGPQKGVAIDKIPLFEAALSHLADLVAHELGMDPRNEPGSGAAGGLGFGLMTFCKALTRPGFDVVAEVTGLEASAREADLVITGEGCLDGQTLHGKGPVCMADLARSFGKPSAVIGGMVEAHSVPALRTRFDVVMAACTPETLHEALARPAEAVRAAINSNAASLNAVLE